MEQAKPFLMGFLFIVGILYCCAWLIQTHLLLNWDVSWLMLVTDRMLAGGQYVKDFFETNPPMILYLYIPPVILTKIFLIKNIALSLRVYMFVLASFSLWLCFYFMQRIFASKDILFARLFLIILAFIFLILPIYEFGQREHMLIIFIMPYLLAVVCRLQKSSTSIRDHYAVITGLLAGLGFAMKPFFLPALLLVEVYYAYQKRNLLASLRIETVCMLALFIAYVITTFIFHEVYFTVILPYTFRNLYSIKKVSEVAAHPLVFTCCLAGLFYVIQYNVNPYKKLSSVLLVAMLGFILAYFLQRTISYYHMFPAFSLALLMLAISFYNACVRVSMSKIQFLSLTLLCVVAFLFQYFYNKNIGMLALTFTPRVFFLFYFILFSTIFHLAQNNKKPKIVMVSIASIVVMGNVYSYLVQRTDWYSWMFFFTILLLLSLFYLLLSLSKIKEKQKYFVIAILGSLIFFSPYIYTLNSYFFYVEHKKNMHHLITYLKTSAQHKSVYFLSASPVYANPAIDYTEAHYVSRFSFLWMINTLFDPSTSRQQKQIKDSNDLLTMIADDFNRYKPSLVFVDVNNTYSLEKIHFKWLDFLLQSQQFRKEWNAYCYLTTVNELLSPTSFLSRPYQFEVWERCRADSL